MQNHSPLGSVSEVLLTVTAHCEQDPKGYVPQVLQGSFLKIPLCSLCVSITPIDPAFLFVICRFFCHNVSQDGILSQNGPMFGEDFSHLIMFIGIFNDNPSDIVLPLFAFRFENKVLSLGVLDMVKSLS